MSDMTKSQRMKELERLLLIPGRKWKKSELAAELNVHRSQIGRYLNELEASVPVLEESGRFYIDPEQYISHIPMNIHEKLALHLATRLLVRKSDVASKHFSSLLEKLEICFAHRHNSAMAGVVADTCSSFKEKEESKKKSQILEYLNKAWLEGYKLRITYRSSPEKEAKTRTCAVYYLEPYAEGLSLHVVAYDFDQDTMIQFKFERIEKVCLTSERYDIPEDFSASDYFKNAWGIWVEEGEPVSVKLRFDKDVAKRVRENRWHSSQETEELGDGFLLWSCRVNQPREMVPWIRSWGSGVEVLEPAELRDFMKEEARKLGTLYQGE